MPQFPTFEAACEALKIEPILPDVSMLPERFRKSNIANHKLDVIIEATNEGHIFDWNNYSESKYILWWNMETYGDAPGSGFSLYCVDGGRGFTRVSARRVFKTREDAEYVGKTHIDLFRDAMKQ